MKNKDMLHVAAFTLVIVGALNWGLIALFNLNLVSVIFGPFGLTQLVYILVGVAAVYIFVTHQHDCMICSKMMKKR